MDQKDSIVFQLQNRISNLEKQQQKDSALLNYITYTAKDTQGRLTSVEKSNNSFSKSDYISLLSVLISLISSICLALYFIYRVFDKRIVEKRKFLNGEWTSEGDVTNPQPLPYLSFKLDTDITDGEIIGSLIPYHEEFPGVLSINGRLKYKTAKIKITHYSRGQLIVYGKAKLRIRGKLLYWYTIKGDNDLLPSKVYTWKIS